MTDEARWRQIRDDLEAVLSGCTSAAALVESRRAAASPLAPRHTPEILTEVKLDNEASRDFTVVEVVTGDRPGVLHAITRTLHAEGLDIHRSKVATWAGRVADVFYVRDERRGGKVEDAARLEHLREALRGALPG